MPGQLVFDDMKWSKIQDLLKAFSHSRKNQYVLINPESGLRIEHENVQIYTIGLTTQKSEQAQKYGFRLPESKKHSENEPDLRQYEPESYLILRPNPEMLPEELQGTETWVIQVIDAEKMDLYVPVAQFVIETFGVDVYMTAEEKKDNDPDHPESEPVDARFPKGTQFCRLISKK